MAPAANVMAAALADVAMTPVTVPVIANVTAAPVTAPPEIRRLLVEQVTGMVRWRECVLTMRAEGVETLVEIGAGKVLAGLARRIDKDLETVSLGTPEAVEEFLKGV
jgi:[acyl-carrier-protein] S-malonyltransferase